MELGAVVPPRYVISIYIARLHEALEPKVPYLLTEVLEAFTAVDMYICRPHSLLIGVASRTDSKICTILIGLD